MKRAASSGRSVLATHHTQKVQPLQMRISLNESAFCENVAALQIDAHIDRMAHAKLYLVVGQMFLMIVPCLVYLLTLLSFH